MLHYRQNKLGLGKTLHGAERTSLMKRRRKGNSKGNGEKKRLKEDHEAFKVRVAQITTVQITNVPSKIFQKWIQFYDTRYAYDELYIKFASKNDFEIFWNLFVVAIGTDLTKILYWIKRKKR